MKRKELAGFKFIVDNGFASELPVAETIMSQPVEAFEVPRDIRKASMQEKKTDLMMFLEEELDVPEFMMNRNKTKYKNNVIHVDFGKQPHKEVIDGEKIVDSIISTGKKVLQPIKNYFFGEEN